MVTARNRTILDVRQTEVFGDKNYKEQRGFDGDIAKNPNYKKMLLWPLKKSAVISSAL
jgi:hypothetical protein